MRNDIDGRLFFDKHSGINILLDEIIIENPSLAPRHTSFAVTNRCNLSCAHCYVSHENNDLDINIAKKWVDELNLYGCLSIGIGGGEPTMWEYLFEFIDHIEKTPMAITLTTNGSATYEFYETILKKINLLRFSIDGIGKTYEKYRKQPYDELVSKIYDLSINNQNIGLNYLLTDETVKQLNEFLHLILKIRPRELLLIPCLNKNGQRELSFESEQIIRNWVTVNKGSLPLAFSYSSIDMISDFALPIQNYDAKKQHHYFLHINACGELVKNVFDLNRIKITTSLEEALRKIGELK